MTITLTIYWKPGCYRNRRFTLVRVDYSDVSDFIYSLEKSDSVDSYCVEGIDPISTVSHPKWRPG